MYIYSVCSLFVYCPLKKHSESESEWFTGDRQIDNTSPGGAPGGKLVPGSHKRCVFIIRIF